MINKIYRSCYAIKISLQEIVTITLIKLVVKLVVKLGSNIDTYFTFNLLKGIAKDDVVVFNYDLKSECVSDVDNKYIYTHNVKTQLSYVFYNCNYCCLFSTNSKTNQPKVEITNEIQ